ncbi:MAG: hypothetical protein LUE29_09610 [Lachnospiraceae bacterium]|nr:hypothetical protein [Lachnospiraceae bacterium]
MVKFETGQVMTTNGVVEEQKRDIFFNLFVGISLIRFKYGDWGDLDEEDKQTNEDALKHGNRLMGSYIYDKDEILNYINSMHNTEKYTPKKTEDKDPEGLKIWIITEWDRSYTTILFPEEY